MSWKNRTCGECDYYLRPRHPIMREWGDNDKWSFCIWGPPYIEPGDMGVFNQKTYPDRHPKVSKGNYACGRFKEEVQDA